MLTLVAVEFSKLKRTLIPVLCFAAPLCVAIFSFLFLFKNNGDAKWREYIGEAALTWAYFLLPMSITALTVLLAQIEHGPKMWRHILALPAPRPALYAAKIIVAAAFVGLMSAVCYILIYLALWLGETLRPGVQLTDDPEFVETAVAFALMFLGALMMIVVQLWAALRFRGYAIPLVLGIIGTFAALAVGSSLDGVFLPWFIPAYVLRLTEPVSQVAVWVGAIGGLALAGLMIAHLSWRETAES